MILFQMDYWHVANIEERDQSENIRNCVNEPILLSSAISLRIFLVFTGFVNR